MYEAALLACLMGNPKHCMEATDIRGPYPTAEQCEERLVEMTRDTIKMWKEFGAPILIVRTGCKERKSI